METNIIGAAATAECGENPLLTYAFISVLVASVKLQMCTQLFCGQTTHNGIPVTTPAGKCAPDINNASGNRSTRALITAELHPWTGLRRGTPRNGESFTRGV